jgi:hypothetical protein
MVTCVEHEGIFFPLVTRVSDKKFSSWVSYMSFAEELLATAVPSVIPEIWAGTGKGDAGHMPGKKYPELSNATRKIGNT